MLGEGVCGMGACHAAGAGVSAGTAAAHSPKRGASTAQRCEGDLPMMAFTQPRTAASEARCVGNPPIEVGRYGGSASVVGMARGALTDASEKPRPAPARPGLQLKAALRSGAGPKSGARPAPRMHPAPNTGARAGPPKAGRARPPGACRRRGILPPRLPRARLPHPTGRQGSRMLHGTRTAQASTVPATRPHAGRTQRRGTVGRMKLESIRVRNYRSIRDATLELDALTVLVGANGAGKSSFVKTLELFWSGRPAVAAEDYHYRNVENPIKITLSFGGMSKAERDAFEPYSPDGRLVVERAFEWADGACKPGPTYVLRHRDSKLDAARDGGTVEIKQFYADNLRMFENKVLTKIADIKEEFKRNEAARHAELKRSPDPESTADLAGARPDWPRGLVKIMFVGAVRDASDEVQDSKTSLITELTRAIADDLANSQKLSEFRDRASKKYGSIAEEVEKAELARVEKNLSENLGNLIDGGAVKLSWPDKTLEVKPPRTAVAVSEGGGTFAVERTGHGSQQALIMAMLQTLAAGPGAAAGLGGAGPGRPSLILAVEEPELYQHPIRQRYMARFLHELSAGTNGQPIQVVCTTHSPHFACIDRLDGIRLIKKPSQGGRQETRASRTSVGCITSALKAAGKTPPAKSAFENTLKVIMTPWLNEGFFANTVVLVEGEADYAAILGTARLLGHDFERIGILVIPCGGKLKMDKPMAIYRTLRVLTFAVWDGERNKRAKGPGQRSDAGMCKESADAGSDKRKSGSGAHADPTERMNAGMNRHYLSLLGNKATDWPSGTYKNCASFEDDLEKEIKDSVGDQLLGELLKEEMDMYQFDSEKTAMKKSPIMLCVLKKASDRGKPCRPLEKVVNAILKWHRLHATESHAGSPAAAAPEGEGEA